MKVGIAYRNQIEASIAGSAATEEALRTGGITRPGLVLAFCSGTVDHDAFFAGIVSVVGKSVPIVGGSAIGIITNRELSYKGYPAGVAVFESDDTNWKIACADRLDRDELAAGEKIGRSLHLRGNDSTLLLFYDSLKVAAAGNSPPIMNASPPLLRGIGVGCGGAPRIVGAGLLGDYTFETSVQFCKDHVGKQTAVGVQFEGPGKIYSRIMHGCTPLDGIYHTVTRAEGAVLIEVDGRPAVELIDILYGSTDWRKQIPVRRLCFGVNNGEKYAEYKEGDFINRLIAGVLPDNSGVVLFEPDLPEGTEILFMLRDAEEMIPSARRNTGDLLRQIETDGRRALFGLYIDCGGRAAEFSWTQTEEADEVQQLFNNRGIPLLGFYSGVEIAPLGGISRGLDWTGVLMVMTESSSNGALK